MSLARVGYTDGRGSRASPAEPSPLTHPDVLGAIGISIIAASLLALIVRRVGQPLILGYILGGVLLGPHIGVGLIADEASIELISEMGLILLLFIIGLEISIPRLLQAGRAI